MRALLRAACLLAAAWPVIAPVPALAADPLTPDDAVLEALTANPDLAAAGHAIDMARGRMTQAGVWTNPEIEIEGANDFLSGGGGERGLSTGFEQRFPVAGRLRKARDAARVDVALAEAELLDARRLLIAEVRRRAYGMLALEAKRSSQDGLIRRAEELLQVARARLRVAEVSEAEVSVLRLEIGRLGEERRLTEISLRREAARFSALLGRTPGPIPDLEGDLESKTTLAPHDELMNLALRQRPDLAFRRLEVDRGEAEERLARSQKWEDWAVGMFHQADRQTFDPPGSGGPLGVESPSTDHLVGLRVKIPLPLWNRNQGRIAETRAGQRRARARVAAAELSVRTEVEGAWAEVERLEQARAAYRDDLIGVADRTMELLGKGYREGLTGISELVQAQQQAALLRQRYYETLGELWRARIDLEAASASSPFLSPASSDAARTP